MKPVVENHDGIFVYDRKAWDVCKKESSGRVLF